MIEKSTRRACAALALPVGGARRLLATLIVLASCCWQAACGGGGGAKTLSQDELRDPTTCLSCHPAQFAQWSRSMHAYASDDPVFIAMNQRGQRETAGALGDFCVKCHAPLALRDGLTTDGQNLATLPAASRGVTCFFCHSARSIDGDHNNPLKLTTEGRMLGPIADPAPGATHLSGYSTLFDGTQADSAAACGSCHDIVNQHGVALERTYQEWQATRFAIQPHGQSCAQCHMDGSNGPASTVSTITRRLHDHSFPAVDVPLTAFPGADVDAQRASAQARLDTTLQGTICVDDIARKITLALDNVAAGHSWPSGASQDRRAWVDLTAYAADQVIYRSGVAAGESVEAAADPDLWTIRDCIFDQNNQEAHMFWEAASLTSNAIPGPVTPLLTDQTTFTRSHLKRIYPVSAPLIGVPDRITLQVFLDPIGEDVLQSLVQSNDLAPAIAAAVPRYQIGGGAALQWTRAGAVPYRDDRTGNQLLCVTAGSMFTSVNTIVAATSHARCDTQP
jgi:Cytochrome c554 and c-prime